MLTQMSPGMRELLLNEVVPQIGQGQVPAAAKQLLDSVHTEDFLWTPVSIQTFITDPYFLGTILHDGLYPKLLEDLIELFSGSYSEVLLAGSIGWGKSTMAEVGMAYDIYLVSCLKSPAVTYGLLRGSNLAFINASVNKVQARKILFNGIGNLMKSSPYFREKFPYDRNLLTELRFPRGIAAYPVAANETSLLGEGVFSAAFDEMNFYAVVEKSKQNPEGATYDQALTLYNKMSRRLKSRLNARGSLPGHLWMISSARYPNDFTERKAIEALEDKTIFVRQYSAWETKPKSQFMTGSFQVEVGDITRRSRVLDGSEEGINTERVIEVPMDFKEQFDKDPDAAVRDFAGIPVLSIRPFIGRRDLITEMMQKGKEAGLRHPFTAFTVTLQEEHEHLLTQFLDWVPEEYDQTTKRIIPRHIRAGPYSAHIDLAKTVDAVGVGIVHVVGSKQVSRGFGKDRKYESRPIMRVDLALEVVAPLRGEIRISSVRELLYQLRDLGLQFGVVSYDTWGSVESIQTLQGEGFMAENLSVDKDPSAYEMLKEAIYDGRLLCYEMPVLAMELATICRDDKTGKIDHPPNGKKDVSDSIAGAVFQAEKAWAGGASSQWASVTTVAPQPRSGFADDNEKLWWKVMHNIPLTEDEINRIK
jgi:hypothetical protein